MNLTITVGTSSTPTRPEQWIRWLVVRDKQPAVPNSNPDITDIYAFVLTLRATSSAYSQQEANRLLDTFKWTNNRFAGRFQILWKGMTKVANEASGTRIWKFKKIINVFKPAEFGVAADLNDRGPGQLYLFAWSSEPSTTAGNMPTMDMSCRLSFTDV